LIFLSMVIADQDEAYISRLAKWFRENRAGQFQIMAFTEKESLLRFLSETDLHIDVLLVGEKLLDPVLISKFNTIILGQPVEPANIELKHIDKYLPAPTLCSEILSAISAFDRPGWGKAGKSELIVCMSPEPRLKSTLALYLSKSSPENIYINFESFPFYSTEQCSHRNQKNLSDVLYHIKASKTNVPLALESAVHNIHNGINLILPMDNPKDLWELTEKEFGILVEALVSWGSFKNVIADIELNAGPFMKYWLEFSSLILIPFEITQLNQVRCLKNMLNQSISEKKIRWVLAGDCTKDSIPDEFNNLFIINGLYALTGDWSSLTFDNSILQNITELLSIPAEYKSFQTVTPYF
jgi:hypothetical protein